MCKKTAENISCAVELCLIEYVYLGMHKDNIQGRMSLGLLPIHYLANMVNLKFVGIYLSSEQENAVEFWLTGRYSRWIVLFLAFKIKNVQVFTINICGGFKKKKKVELCTLMKYLGENVHQLKMLKLYVTFLDGLANCSVNLGSTEKKNNFNLCISMV